VSDVHDRLKARGIVPTMDAERAYRLGYDRGERELRSERDELAQRVAYLEQLFVEVGLLSRRATR
jgi:hypothetical protein